MRDGLSRIASYAIPVEAEMACEFLKSNGITAEVDAGLSVSAFGVGNPLSTQSLLVDAAQVAEARVLLSEHVRAQAVGPTAIDPTPGKRFDGYYEVTWNARERAAESAFRAAVIGWFVPFVSWYAIWSLGRVAVLQLPLNAHCARRAKIAAGLMVVPALGYVALAVVIFAP